MPVDLQQAENLCRQVTPLDLGNSPLYVVGTSSLPGELPFDGNCLGFTSGALDLYVRPYVAWNGRGPAMLINDRMLEQERDPQSWLVSIAIHELAHVLDRFHETGSLIGDPITESPIAIEADQMFRRLATPSSSDMPPTFGHEASWVRTALHLRFRSIQLGVFIPVEQLFAADYGIDPLFSTIALGSEIADRANWPIREILATVPPQQFTELWNYDPDHSLTRRNTHDYS